MIDSSIFMICCLLHVLSWLLVSGYWILDTSKRINLIKHNRSVFIYQNFTLKVFVNGLRKNDFFQIAAFAY